MTMPLGLAETDRERLFVDREVDREEAPILSEIVRVFRVYWRPYLILVASVTAVALVLAFLLPARYRATASLMSVGSGMPQGSLGRLARLANIQPIQNELPAETLCTILKSRRVSDSILDATFGRWPGDPDPLPFKNLLTGKPPGSEPPRDKLYRRLSRATHFSMDPETRIVTLAVETRHPHLSAAVANAYLEALGRYTAEEHQARTRMLVGLVAERTGEVRGEILQAEQALHSFIAANQNYATATDPDIRIEQLRLERDLDLRNRVLMNLVGNHEMALLQQRNEAPFIQVIDRGAAPTLRSWPIRRLLVGGALVGSALLGFVLMLVADHLGIRPRGRDVWALAR
jgi:uncharacterized protein involved in exopolysaccharide biosynthesis